MQRDNFKIKLKFSKGFLDYGVKTGELLHYVASLAIDEINELTDKELDSNGQMFAPYAGRRGIGKRTPKRGDDGKIVRHPDGKWIWADDPPRVPVTLRSPYKIQDGKRMRDNIAVSPKIIKPNAKSVRIRALGTRGHYKFKMTVRNEIRANTCHETNRVFLAVSQATVDKILAGIKHGDLMAYVKKKRREAVDDATLKAERKVKRKLAASRRAAKTAFANAANRHKQALAALERAGFVIDPVVLQKITKTRRARKTRKRR